MTKKSKAQADAMRRYDRQTLYGPKDAIELVKTLAHAKFDESVDAVFTLSIDARKADQLVRGTVSLPHGTGKSVRVLVFADGEQAREADGAGADIVGAKDLAEEISAGRELDFDVAIATPDMMPHVGKLGPILGPRGLMPNPKSGTVTQDVAKAVAEFKAGRVEYRNDRYGNVAVGIGKASFGEEQLLENLQTLTGEINRARPAAAKGRYMKRLTISSTMGVGVKVDVGALPESS